MLSVEDAVRYGMQLAGRGDKPSADDFAQALKVMQMILSDWAATRDVHLWNIFDKTVDVPIGDRVSAADGSVYQCYIDHTSSDDDEPNTADLYSDYWTQTQLTESPLTWAAENDYLANRNIGFSDKLVDDVLSVFVQHNGQMSSVEKISLLDFRELPKDELGLPTKYCVEKTASGISLNLWPLCDKENAKLFYYEIRRPNILNGAGIFDLPDQWIQAVYYALAVELGFLYNINGQRLSMLGQKAALEFKKAFLTNESEVDECFVKPLY